jgi:hypothetical protein
MVEVQFVSQQIASSARAIFCFMFEVGVAST